MNYAAEANKRAQWADAELEEAEATRYYTDQDATTSQAYARAQVHATLSMTSAILALVDMERSRR